MKVFVVLSIISAFFMLLMAGASLCVCANSAARIAAEQCDFENYEFVMPDGEVIIPANVEFVLP